MKKLVGLLTVLVLLTPLSLAVPQGSVPEYSVDGPFTATPSK